MLLCQHFKHNSHKGYVVILFFFLHLYKQMLIWIKVKQSITKRIFPDLLVQTSSFGAVD